ncbi:DUF3558 domain-containing protein [Kutzneria sp. NPDC052558]|uniref:DUF3558 domain-containing protein n=1 Tax=Kutzneria sp. NPDC052558 TaxID=3364121 RepID=UPI0037CAD9C9
MAVVLGTTAVAALASGCSPTPSPTPTGTTTTTDSDSAASSGAPKVKTPLDTMKFQAAPCSTLTSAQVQSVGINAQASTADVATALGPGCRWTQNDGGTGFTVQFVTSNTKGLSTLYAQKDSLNDGGYFTPIADIQGYPAVLYSPVDDRSSGTCGVAVGVSDTLDYSVALTSATTAPSRSDPCPVAEKIADLVMTTLRGGS